MNPSRYFKSRIGYFITLLVVILITACILFAFKVSSEAIIITVVIMVIGVIVAETAEYLRRKRFYDMVISSLEELDRKDLLPEILERPDFYEGQVLYDVLRETGKSMTERIGDYRRENADFREFIELWVHEIKLPVASLYLMSHNDGNTRYMEQLRRIDDYIENVLFYSRSNSAEKDFIFKEVSLKRVFTDVALKYREEIQGHDISLETEGLDVRVTTDSKWITYILSQLMSNSIKYASPDRDSVIRVWAEELPDRTVLHFRDNGIGISEADLPRIFEKSFTGENGHSESKATGMGLYLVGKLCDKLGHDIKAESVKDEYTEIQISFGKNRMHEVL